MPEKSFARIDLDWSRHATYELSSERIVASGCARPYKPAENDDLFWRFVRLETVDDLLSFMKSFGPLTEDGCDPEQGEDVRRVLGYARLFRELLAWGDASEELGSVLHQHGGMNFGQATLWLGIEPSTGTPRLYLQPQSLLGLLYLRLGQVLADPQPLRTCLHCGSYFRVGPGTARRIDAKFCKDDCQIRFNSLKRTPKEARRA